MADRVRGVPVIGGRNERNRRARRPHRKREAGFIINPYRYAAAGGGGGGDSAWDDVQALLHFSSYDGATKCWDETGRIWTANGSAQIDDAQMVYGPTSLLQTSATDYLSAGSSADFAYGTGDFTIEFFGRPSNVDASERTWYDQRVGSTDVAPAISVLANGAIRYYTDGAQRIISSAGAITVDTWHHIALCRDGGTTRLFVDGSQVGSDYTDGNDYIASPVILGQAGDSLAGALGFVGHLQGLRITNGTARYSGAFTAPSGRHASNGDPTPVILTHGYGDDNDTAIRSQDPGYRVGTFNGSAIIDTAQSKFGGSSFFFTGTVGDYVSFPDSDDYNIGTSDFCIEAWFRFNGVDPADDAMTDEGATIFAQYSNSGPNEAFQLTVLDTSGGGRIRWRWTTDGSSNQTQQTAPLTWEPDQWYHVAIARDGDDLRLFLDGTEVAMTGDTFDSSTSVSTSNQPFCIGQTTIATSGFRNPMDGWIGEVRFVIGAPVRTTAFTPPTSPLTY